MTAEEKMPEQEAVPEPAMPAEPEAAMESQATEQPVADVSEPFTAPSGEWKAQETTDNDRLMAALSYASQVAIPILVPAVMLLAEESKGRPFQKFHAIQSLGFLVATIIYEVLAAIVYCGLTSITGGCLGCLLWLIFLVPVVPALYYAYRAYQGMYFKIPFLTDFLVQNKWLDMPVA
jgi:uncharacterized membrane protein